MKKYTLFSLLGLLLCLASCKQGPEFGDALYVTGTLSSPQVKFLVEGNYSAVGLTVTSTTKAENDIKVKMEAAPGLLAAYSAQQGREYQLPPEGSYALEGSEMIINAGKSQSSQISLSADASKLQEGVAYCLPVTITSVEGTDQKVLETSRTAYVMFKKVINIKAAYLARRGCFDIPGFGGEDSPVKALGQMTLEMKVLPVSFPFGSESNANGISSLCGCEENFLFRFGDGAGNPVNKLQFVKGSIGAASHPDKKDHYESWVEKEFPTGHWLHFAAVYDGQYLRLYLDGEQIHFVETNNGGTINLSMAYDGHTWEDTFAIGRSAGHKRFFDGYVSECRVWNVARSAAELDDGVCYVDPTSEGLIAYWRFNGETQEDGTVLDETGHGYNAVPYGSISYVDNQKCPF